MRRSIAAIFLSLLLTTGGALAATPAHVLTITTDHEAVSLTTAALLAHPETRDITITGDVSYGKAMHYKAIPLAVLFRNIKIPPAARVMEVVATDGFVASLPVDATLHPKKGAAEAFLAIEPPAAPWPPLAGKKVSPGPFYIVWKKPEASGIRSEQWPYMIAGLRFANAPEERWKEAAVDPALPADAPARAGQKVFMTQCMACHKMNGAGSAEAGPDLNQPANPVEYFKPDALKKYIRDPASLRRWPGMQMPGFTSDALSDRDIDLIIAYLQHMAARKKP